MGNVKTKKYKLILSALITFFVLALVNPPTYEKKIVEILINEYIVIIVPENLVISVTGIISFTMMAILIIPRVAQPTKNVVRLENILVVICTENLQKIKTTNLESTIAPYLRAASTRMSNYQKSKNKKSKYSIKYYNK